VALAHQAERVLVVAHPDVEPVLLDAPRGSPARGPLASEPPSLLKHRDLVSPFGAGQLERRGQASASATDDGHPLPARPSAHDREKLTALGDRDLDGGEDLVAVKNEVSARIDAGDQIAGSQANERDENARFIGADPNVPGWDR